MDPFNQNAAQVIAQLLQDPSQVGFMQMRGLRQQFNNDPTMQAILAPYEHQAYARETVQQGGWPAALQQALAIPGYQAAKALGLASGRSGTSDPLAQMIQAYKGIWQGLQ